MRNVALDSPGDAIVVAKSVWFSRECGHLAEARNNEDDRGNEGWCSVPGCCLPFPEPPDSHWKSGFTFKYKQRTKVVWQAAGLCNTHFKRLSKLKDLGDTSALEHFRELVCNVEVPCLAPEFEQLLVNYPGSTTHKRANVYYERALGAKSSSCR